MGFYDGPSIVNSGLILSLDAADKNSYAGSGTVWNDLTGIGNTSNLVNGPIFANSYGGAIVLDGTNDYVSGSQNISFPTGSQPLTIETWVNSQDTGTGAIFNYGLGASSNRVEIGTRASNYIVVAIAASAYGFSDASNLNNWMHLVAIPGALNSQTVIYKNGVQQSLVLQSGTDLARNISKVSSYFVGVIADATGSVLIANCFSGSIASVKLYNRELSEDEILKNYNAQKSRFGL